MIRKIILSTVRKVNKLLLSNQNEKIAIEKIFKSKKVYNYIDVEKLS